MAASSYTNGNINGLIDIFLSHPYWQCKTYRSQDLEEVLLTPIAKLGDNFIIIGITMSIPQRIQEVYNKSTCIYTKEQIETALDKMAIHIHNRLSESNPILLCVLKGGIVLAGNLMPRLDFPLELDCVHATRYRGATQGGELFWKVIPEVHLKDRTVLILDDILDGGITLQSIVDFCYSEGAKEVLTAVLLDKTEARIEGGLPSADFAALTVDDRFVFGYGLDYEEYLRNAPGIFEVAPEHQ